MRTRQQWLGLIAVITLAWPGQDRANGDLDVEALIALYRAGEYSAFETSARRVEDWTAVAAAVRRRRLNLPARAAAAFSLELAAAAASAGQGLSLFRSLVESGCSYVRGARPALDSAFQVHWHQSAIAVLHGQDAELPFGRQVGDTWEHFAHVTALSRDVAVLRFALAITHEQRVHFADAAQGVAFRAPDVLRTNSTLELQYRSRELELFRSWRNHQLDEAGRLYAGLMADIDVGSEAKLRLGVVKVMAGNVRDGLGLFGQVARSGADHRLRYLAYVFIGRVLLDLNRPLEAAAAFERSLEVKPQASSALLGRAAAYAMAGKSVEASKDAESSLTSGAGPDPWVEYPFGNYRSWPVLRERLREMAK